MRSLRRFVNQTCRTKLCILRKQQPNLQKKKKKTAENISDITKTAPTSLIPDQTCCPKIRNLFKFFPPSGNIVAEMVKFIF